MKSSAIIMEKCSVITVTRYTSAFPSHRLFAWEVSFR